MAAWISISCIDNQNSYNTYSGAAQLKPPRWRVARTLVQCPLYLKISLLYRLGRYDGITVYQGINKY